MSTLIVRGESNTPGMKDYTGAFLPESISYSNLHTEMLYVLTFDNTLPFGKRAGQVLKRLKAFAPNVTFDNVVIFCHGWGDGIQAGFTRRNVKTLVAALTAAVEDDVTIILYCCSTGDDPDHDDLSAAPGWVAPIGEGSFADAFRDELCKAGHTECRVVAHTTAGHATRNPHAIFFEGLGSPIGGVGGVEPVTPKQKQLWRTWVKLLKTSFRFEYPYMTVGEIHDRILAEKCGMGKANV